MTAITIHVPNREVSFFKKIIKKLGWTYTEAEVESTAAKKPRLYDPESGEYLNEKTMKTIENMRSGKDQGTSYDSFEDFEKAIRAL